MAYLDELSDNQLGALEEVLGDLASGKKPTTSIRDILDGAPALGKTTTFYRYYKTSSFKGNTDEGRMYSFEADSYVVASTKELPSKSGATVLAFKMPAKAKVVPLGDDGVLMDKGTVYYIPDSDAVWPATIQEVAALTASVRPAPTAPMMFFNGGPVPERCEECGMSPIDQFYNRCHAPNSGKFCDARGRGPRGQGGGRPGGQGGGRPGGGDRGRQGQKANLTRAQKAERRANTYRNILGAVTATIGVVAVVASAINAVGTIDTGRGARRTVDREQAVERERQRRGIPQREQRRRLEQEVRITRVRERARRGEPSVDLNPGEQRIASWLQS